MVISFQGLESFKITQGELSISINPKSKVGSDIVLISTKAFMTEAREGSFVITGPGEYEVKDIGIKGFLSPNFNTIYTINFEGMNLCFLGALSSGELTPETFEALEDVDVLFVPIGGGEVLDASTAYKLAVSLEPKVIIPMHYDKKALEVFLKEGGEEKAEPTDKFVIKKKDLEGKEGEIVVLKEE